MPGDNGAVMPGDARDLDDMLVVRHLNPRAPGESLRSCIDRLISWEVSVNLDPSASSAASALVVLGRSSRRPLTPKQIADACADLPIPHSDYAVARAVEKAHEILPAGRPGRKPEQPPAISQTPT